MNWRKPLMTDSGGFQVFSLGFGKDLGVGKILKYFPGDKNKDKGDLITKNSQPKFLKITDEGVYFRSPLNGKELFIGPKESVKIQESLGADMIFAFDECTAPLSNHEYVKSALKRTHYWAGICLKQKKSKQAIYGIIQGSKFKDLRKLSAEFISSLDFDGYGIGGDLGENKKTMEKILGWIMPNLNEKIPRHLLGIGYLEDMERIVKSGIDSFDCIVPTHYARRGIAFTSSGKLNMAQTKFLNPPAGGKNPLDKKCGCYVCQNYSRSYICHLFKANEITALKLLTFHNLYLFNNFIKNIRSKIKKGIL